MEKKPDIKIFVSHRIDLDSETIDNPLYVNVRCGAVFDKRENVDMLGDDTGDNISEKRDSFCELTVMYWAWKNVKADYYGLCHYRRYLSFAEDEISERMNKNAVDANKIFYIENYITEQSIIKHALNAEKMLSTIRDVDVITSPAETVNTMTDGPFISVYDLCEKRSRDFDMHGIDVMLDIIKQYYPKYYKCATKYMEGNSVKFYNCFVMKKEYFNELCEFMFGVLFRVEKQLDTKDYNVWKTRMPGFMGEHLIGIYLLYISDKKFLFKPLVYFSDVSKAKTIFPAFDVNNVPIVFSCSNEFVPYASVFIKSILIYISKDKNYDFVVLEKSISDANKKRLKMIASGFSNVSIRFYNPSPLLKNNAFFVNSVQQSEAAYYRLLAPYILSKYNGKALVMDCDIVLKNDIAVLLDYNLDDKIAAIASDVVYHAWFAADKKLQEYCKKELKMKDPLNYVNTGVMVVNLNKYRQTFSMEKIINIATLKKYMIQEQDVLNLILEGDIKFLPLEWNMYLPVNEGIKNLIDNYASCREKKKYYDAYSKPYLLHWAAQPKPWINPDVDLADEWWKIARQTDFYEKILFQMHFNNYPIFEQHTLIRRMADKYLPIGSMRRELLKKIMPRGSKQFEFLKKLYHKVTF